MGYRRNTWSTCCGRDDGVRCTKRIAHGTHCWKHADQAPPSLRVLRPGHSPTCTVTLGHYALACKEA